MKITRGTDTLFNVILPLLAGYLIYRTASIGGIPLFIKNYFPDALWAWSLISVILIIWNRQFHFSWIVTCYLGAVSFELFQYFHFLPGTGDIADITVYFIFLSGGLAFNNYFKKKFTTITN